MFKKHFPASKPKDEAQGRRDPWMGMDQFWQNAMSPYTSGVAPVVDVSETETEVRVAAELPGMDVNDIQLTLDQGVLVIKGEKKREEEHKGEGFHRVERSYGSFSRAIRLPTTCLETKVQAEYKNGVLSVRIPKDQKFCARRIEIEG